jgi:biotin operon repressor
MNQEKINFLDFRKEYNIPAADLKAICKEIGLAVVREGTEQFIVGENPHSVSNAYYLKHAVMEYRGTMYVTKTKAGNFFEYEIEMKDGKGYVGVHAFDKDAVEPKTPSLKREPNKQSKSVLVPVDRGAELMMRKASAPPAPLQAPVGMDALQVLVAALTEAQRASTPPDTLHPQKTLLEAAEQGFLITTEQLGQLLGMSKGTISSKKSGFRKLGFEFEKVKEGSTNLWKAKKY